ncbi:MAG: hypothetical protein AAF670_00355 [Planctomycetota bacterium]
MTGDLLTVVDRLGDESISLEIIGGHAVNVHGYALVDDLIAGAATLKGRPYASLSWLRRMKSASGRPVDRVDLQSLPLPDRE